jgi:hypothetical protein
LLVFEDKYVPHRQRQSGRFNVEHGDRGGQCEVAGTGKGLVVDATSTSV